MKTPAEQMKDDVAKGVTMIVDDLQTIFDTESVKESDPDRVAAMRERAAQACVDLENWKDSMIARVPEDYDPDAGRPLPADLAGEIRELINIVTSLSRKVKGLQSA